MNSLWNDAEAAAFLDDPKQLRVYTSRLLGQDPDLVLHGGGNTSVKLTEPDFFGEPVEQLFVKGSGWDLGTIEVAGFAPLRLAPLLRLAELETLSDTDMVTQQRVVMTDPNAPNASVEAILHALIPFRFVDHTHADAIVTLTNTPDGEARIREVFGERVLVIPYVMPGFILARTVYELTRDTDWSAYDGMVLLNHGLFTFDDDARASYENTIRLVSEAEAFLEREAPRSEPSAVPPPADLAGLAALRRAVADARGCPVIAALDTRPEQHAYAARPDIAAIGTRGPVTPDHSIRTKRIPMLLDGEPSAVVAAYGADYQAYFEAHREADMTMLDPAPRWAIWPGQGTVSFGASMKEAAIIRDIAEHTAKVVQQAEALGGWSALSAKDIFDVEYWELEQAKLKKVKAALPLQGKVALVTGAASGIGRASAEALHAAGAAVLACDIDPEITSVFAQSDLIGLVCDVANPAALLESVEASVRAFGGLDIVVSNAGVFSQGQPIESLDAASWDKSLTLNLTQHQRLLQYSIPFLKQGIDPSFLIVGSKNVTAPGPGAAAYSVAKAGLNQLMRVAALELGGDGIRVNIIHPDCVYDTGLWANGVLASRATAYGMSEAEYMSRNVLGAPVASTEVAQLLVTLAGPVFAKTTGAQIPIDGGNDRVI